MRCGCCDWGEGEGRHLQFANVLVNYDLPWQPMKIEPGSVASITSGMRNGLGCLSLRLFFWAFRKRHPVHQFLRHLRHERIEDPGNIQSLVDIQR